MIKAILILVGIGMVGWIYGMKRRARMEDKEMIKRLLKPPRIVYISGIGCVKLSAER